MDLEHRLDLSPDLELSPIIFLARPDLFFLVLSPCGIHNFCLAQISLSWFFLRVGFLVLGGTVGLLLSGRDFLFLRGTAGVPFGGLDFLFLTGLLRQTWGFLVRCSAPANGDLLLLRCPLDELYLYLIHLDTSIFDCA